jgi:hypothetical protein
MDIGFDGLICSGGAYIEVDGKLVYSAFLQRNTLGRLTAYFSEWHAGFSLELPEKILASPQFFASPLPRRMIRLFERAMKARRRWRCCARNRFSGIKV